MAGRAVHFALEGALEAAGGRVRLEVADIEARAEEETVEQERSAGQDRQEDRHVANRRGHARALDQGTNRCKPGGLGGEFRGDVLRRAHHGLAHQIARGTVAVSVAPKLKSDEWIAVQFPAVGQEFGYLILELAGRVGNANTVLLPGSGTW